MGMTYGSVDAVTQLEGLEAISALIQSTSSFSSLVSLVLYLLLAFGLYTIAQRRQIERAWLAFIPIANVWILGSISDHFQYAQNGTVRSRRKLLVTLEIIKCLLCIVFAFSLVGIFVQVIVNYGYFESLAPTEALAMLLQQILPTIGLGSLAAIVSLIAAIFQWICYYQLFASCTPDNKVLFIVLGIIFSFLMPIFVFVCRNKDEGMPTVTDLPM